MTLLLIVMALWSAEVIAAPVSVSARSTTVSRPATTTASRSSTTRPASTTRYASAPHRRTTTGVSTPLFIPVSHLVDEADDVWEEIAVATPLLTVCTKGELAQAKAWQRDCQALDTINASYCPLLSYFRHCQAAAPADVVGLTPAEPRYRHVYMAKGSG